MDVHQVPIGIVSMRMKALIVDQRRCDGGTPVPGALV